MLYHQQLFQVQHAVQTHTSVHCVRQRVYLFQKEGEMEHRVGMWRELCAVVGGRDCREGERRGRVGVGML